MRYIPLVMIKSLELTNIRNFEKKSIKFNEGLTYIYGINGSGKTTILEAIHLIATTKSHRTTEDKEIIKEGAPFGKITLKDDHHLYEMVITSQGKRVWLDQIEKKKLSNFIGHLHVVMFAPEDIDLVKGNPQTKRHFLDVSMVQIDKIYIETLMIYKKILKQRNALLKKLQKSDDMIFLKVINDQLVEAGNKIINDRLKFIERLEKEFKAVCKTFQLEMTSLKYKPSVEESHFKESLEQSINQDILSKTTNYGPHRDDLIIGFKNKNAKHVASQGQSRLLALALKIAYYNLIKINSNNQVTLLLDDVLSELDQLNQSRVIELNKDSEQTIINSAVLLEITKTNHIDL